ncbi:MAG: wax ester/triacylglycerol synthase family O-acyltransferase [Novosphingobium sp.]
MQQLGPQDAMYVYLETPTTPLQIGWLNVYDPATAPGGKVRFKAILDHVAQRLHTVPCFHQRLVRVPGDMDHPYWVEDEAFDLENHVHHVALPKPGDWRQLCILAARLFARPLDFSRPLWEFHVIEGLDSVEGFPKGSFALLAKIHHAAVDGVSGVEVTTHLHTTEPFAPPPSPPSALRAQEPEAAPSVVQMLARGYMATLRHPGRLIGHVAKVVPGIKRTRAGFAAGEFNNPGKLKVPRTLFSGSIGPHRAVEARRFPLDGIRRIRALAPGSTVNEVLLAVVAGAMRGYLLDKRALPDGTLICTCPISLRTEEHDGQLGNQIANMLVALGTDLADPAERLRFIREQSLSAKGFTEAVGARTMSEASQLMPGALMGLGARLNSRLALADRRAGSANTTLTNVPGPRAPLYLAGARLVTQFGLGPVLEGLGIFHAALSYCGEVTLTIVADRDKLPDPAVYAACIQASYDELLAAADGIEPPAVAKPRRRTRSAS